MIDLRGIETFYWVATLGGFRAAADKLHASQPAISQRISQLEEQLGTRLFERDRRSVRLTVRGQALLTQAERMLQLRQDMLALAREENAIAGRLTLGVAETIVQTWLPTLLARVHDLFPALALEIEVDNTPPMRTDLLAHRIDLAFLMGPLPEAEVENLDLCRYPLAWLSSPQLDLGTGPLTLQRVAQWPIVTYPASSRPHQAVRQMLVDAGVTNVRMVGSASLSTTVRMVQGGMGVGVFAPAVLRRELAEGQLRLLGVSGAPLPDLSFTASWRRGRDSHVAAAVARLAVQVAGGAGTDSKF